MIAPAVHTRARPRCALRGELDRDDLCLERRQRRPLEARRDADEEHHREDAAASPTAGFERPSTRAPARRPASSAPVMRMISRRSRRSATWPPTSISPSAGIASTRPRRPSASGSPVTSYVWNATTVAIADMPSADSPRAPSSARNSGSARMDGGPRRGTQSGDGRPTHARDRGRRQGRLVGIPPTRPSGARVGHRPRLIACARGPTGTGRSHGPPARPAPPRAPRPGPPLPPGAG